MLKIIIISAIILAIIIAAFLIIEKLEADKDARIEKQIEDIRKKGDK